MDRYQLRELLRVYPKKPQGPVVINVEQLLLQKKQEHIQLEEKKDNTEKRRKI